jgi:hypothetical protein
MAIFGCRTESLTQPCRVEAEMVLSIAAQSPRDVVVTATAFGFFAAWAEQDRTFAVPLDELGAPTRVPFEISLSSDPLSPSGEGNKALWTSPPSSELSAEALSLAPLSGGAVLGALVPGDPGAAYLCLLTEGGQGPLLRLGEAGPNATNIDVVATAESRLVAAWHMGKDDTSEIALASAAWKEDRLDLLAARPLGRDRTSISPALAASPSGGVLLAFAEVSLGATPSVVVQAQWLGTDLASGQAHAVARGTYLHPTVDVVATEGGYALVYRDDADDDDVPEYYHVSIGLDGSAQTAPARISKADAFVGPRLATQDDLLVAAAIRSFQRNLLVGLNRFDKHGRKVGGELQIYADKTDFVRADVARGEGFLLLAYGEDRDGSGRVLASRVRCKP